MKFAICVLALAFPAASSSILICSTALPGEGYISTGCPILRSQPIVGEWIPDPADYVWVDALCVENSHYWVEGVPLYSVYDGAVPGDCRPPKADITLIIIIDPTWPVPVPPPVTSEVPEPGTGRLISMVAAIAFAILVCIWYKKQD